MSSGVSCCQTPLVVVRLSEGVLLYGGGTILAIYVELLRQTTYNCQAKQSQNHANIKPSYLSQNLPISFKPGLRDTTQMSQNFVIKVITGPPAHGVGCQTSNGLWCLASSSVDVCNTSHMQRNSPRGSKRRRASSVSSPQGDTLFYVRKCEAFTACCKPISSFLCFLAQLFPQIFSTSRNVGYTYLRDLFPFVARSESHVRCEMRMRLLY